MRGHDAVSGTDLKRRCVCSWGSVRPPAAGFRPPPQAQPRFHRPVRLICDQGFSSPLGVLAGRAKIGAPAQRACVCCQRTALGNLPARGVPARSCGRAPCACPVCLTVSSCCLLQRRCTAAMAAGHAKDGPPPPGRRRSVWANSAAGRLPGILLLVSLSTPSVAETYATAVHAHSRQQRCRLIGTVRHLLPRQCRGLLRPQGRRILPRHPPST